MRKDGYYTGGGVSEAFGGHYVPQVGNPSRPWRTVSAAIEYVQNNSLHNYNIKVNAGNYTVGSSTAVGSVYYENEKRLTITTSFNLTMDQSSHLDLSGLNTVVPTTSPWLTVSSNNVGVSITGSGSNYRTGTGNHDPGNSTITTDFLIWLTNSGDYNKLRISDINLKGSTGPSYVTNSIIESSINHRSIALTRVYANYPIPFYFYSDTGSPTTDVDNNRAIFSECYITAKKAISSRATNTKVYVKNSTIVATAVGIDTVNLKQLLIDDVIFKITEGGETIQNSYTTARTPLPLVIGARCISTGPLPSSHPNNQWVNVTRGVLDCNTPDIDIDF
jgi:hypothetical protein